MNANPDFSTSKQDFADIFNIVSQKGRKEKETSFIFNHVLEGITVTDQQQFRIIFTPKGSVTETTNGALKGFLRFDELDPADFREIAENLRKKYPIP